MFVILKLLFIFIITVLVLGLVFVVGFVFNIFSLFRRIKNQNQNQRDSFTRDRQRAENYSSSDYRQTTSGQQPPHGKIIPEDEGEYVDFEEMK